jgi:hypothetical protein
MKNDSGEAQSAPSPTTAEKPAEEQQTRQGLRRNSLLSSVNWQIFSAVGGLIIGVVTIIIGLIAYVSPRSASPSDPDVSVISRSIERLADVELKVEDEPGDKASSSALSVQDNVIDVQLQNKGGTPALVTAVEASVSYARKMQLCPGIGGGILYASALYDVRVPVFTLPSVPTFPIKVEKKLPFRIDANSFDRLAITVGHEKVASGDGPWVYILDLSLRTQNSETLKLGKFAPISPASRVSVLTKNLAELPKYGQDYAGCHEKNWESIVLAMNSGGGMAPALLALNDQYKSSPYLLAPGQKRKF